MLPGRLAGLFRRARTGPYKPLELGVVGVSLLLVFGLPPAWLWRYPWLLAAFGVLMVIAFFEIRLVVCQECGNELCPMRPPA